jgi:hypothetical protein
MTDVGDLPLDFPRLDLLAELVVLRRVELPVSPKLCIVSEAIMGVWQEVAKDSLKNY